MTAHLITGSKQEIAQKVASLEGEVREAIVFVEEHTGSAGLECEGVPGTVQELFAEMEPYMVRVPDFDDSREAIYERQEGE